MALVRCPECGNSISSYAVMCPVCGFPIGEKCRSLDEQLDSILQQSSKEFKAIKKFREVSFNPDDPNEKDKVINSIKLAVQKGVDMVSKVMVSGSAFDAYKKKNDFITGINGIENYILDAFEGSPIDVDEVIEIVPAMVFNALTQIRKKIFNQHELLESTLHLNNGKDYFKFCDSLGSLLEIGELYAKRERDIFRRTKMYRILLDWVEKQIYYTSRFPVNKGKQTEYPLIISRANQAKECALEKKARYENEMASLDTNFKPTIGKKEKSKSREKKKTNFPYIKVVLIWIVIIGIVISVLDKDDGPRRNSSNNSSGIMIEAKDSLSNSRAISIAEDIAEHYLTFGSSIFDLSFSNAEVETDGYNHYIVSMQYHYENSNGERRNKYATVFFTYFPETETYESGILSIKTSDNSAGVLGAKNTFKKDVYYGWGYEDGTAPTPSPQTVDTPTSQEQTLQPYENSYANEEYVYLIEATGIVQPDDNFAEWKLILSSPVIVEDWNGKQECNVLYFYPEDTIGGNSPSVFSGKTVTVSGTPENYRDGGQFFLYAPTLIEVEEVQMTMITKANFENVVDLSQNEYNNSALFEIFFNEQQKASTWEYLGTTYASFSLPEYEFYSFDVFKMDSEYYLIPFNDYTTAPTIYQFVENNTLILVWSYAV